MGNNFFSSALVGTLIMMTVQKMLGASSLASEVVVLLVARLAFQTGGRLSSEQMNIQQPEWIERAETRLLYDVDRDTVRKTIDKKGRVFEIQRSPSFPYPVPPTC